MSQNSIGSLAFAGASTTTGYGLSCSFSSVFKKLLAPGVFRGGQTLSHSAFPALPERVCTRLIEQVGENPPDLLVAVDMLFWFVYGRHQDRMASLEEGLAILGRLTCRFAVGTIPKVPLADESVLPLTLRPSEYELRRVNVRIAEWVAAHPNAVLVPWAETADAHPDFRQEDGMHPSLPGLVALAKALKGALIARGFAASEDFAPVP